MPFKPEIYVLVRMLDNISSFLPPYKRFLLYRSMELCFRSRKALRHFPMEGMKTERKFLHAMVCMRIIDKVHGLDVLCNRNILDRLAEMRAPFTIALFVAMEQSVVQEVGFMLLPCNGFKVEDEDRFVEPWRFMFDQHGVPLTAPHPRQPAWLSADRVNAMVRDHVSSFALLGHLKRITTAEPMFFFFTTNIVQPPLQELHRNVVQYCALDRVFAAIVQHYCLEYFGERSLFLQDVSFSSSNATPGQQADQLEKMIREHSDFAMVELVRLQAAAVELGATNVEDPGALAMAMQTFRYLCDCFESATDVVQAMSLIDNDSSAECCDAVRLLFDQLCVVQGRLTRAASVASG